MATSRTKRVRRDAGQRPEDRRRGSAPPRKRSARSGSGSDRRRAAAHRAVGTTALPGWGELAAAKDQPVPGRAAAHGYLEAVSTAQFAGLILFLAAVFTLYIGHVHATQDLLAELQQVRRENLHLHLKENRLKGEFDHATGPSVIYEQARLLGLEESIVYGPSIKMEY